jgi:hypothetical protein
VTIKERSSKIFGSEFIGDLVFVLKKRHKIFIAAAPPPSLHISKYATANSVANENKIFDVFCV